MNSDNACSALDLPALFSPVKQALCHAEQGGGLLLADDSTLWESFGLNIPANPSPPEPIASLTASALGGGKVLLQWPYATRMTGTRVLAKHLGEDDDFISLGTVDGLTKLVEDETPGVTIEFKVVAYNDGGDAPESPVASVVVT